MGNRYGIQNTGQCQITSDNHGNSSLTQNEDETFMTSI